MSQQTGYLFVHFTGENTPEGEQIYFAISEDGLHWIDCTEEEQPVLRTELGEKGARDPFIIRDVCGKGYYLIATDLRIAAGKGWTDAVTNGSRSILVWKSEDLIHWNKPKLVEIGIPEAGCVWAPEAVYDVKREDYFIFFASNVKEAGEEKAKQRIYFTRTKDFEYFSKAKKYIDRKCDVIDTTIVEHEGLYYRFSKDETTKHIDIDVADDLESKEFRTIKSETLAQLYGVEGPEIYPLPEEGKWCLIVDRFMEGKGYLPLITDNLITGEFRILKEEEFDMGKNCKRHGGILKLTTEEYQRLKEYYHK